jgi:hypothetical protein
VPRYYFNVHDGVSPPDRIGTELPDLKTAHREAIRLAGELLVDHADWFWSGQTWRMEVAGSAGLVLFRLDFAAADVPENTAFSEPDRPRSNRLQLLCS